MTIVNKGTLLKAIGWTTIAVGAYFVYLGEISDGGRIDLNRDDIIDAEFTIIQD